MKIALISDIHGNWFYLDSVSARLESEKVDLIYCLGDLVGHYDAPGAVIDWCMRKNNIDPEAYLADVFARINALRTSELRQLLPDRWSPRLQE